MWKGNEWHLVLMQSRIQVTNSFFKKIWQILKILPTLDMGDLGVILEPLIHVKQGTENLFFFNQARNKLKPNKSIKISILKVIVQPHWASLVAQSLRICLPMQGTRVRALVWEDPTCHGATGPVSHNC